MQIRLTSAAIEKIRDELTQLEKVDRPGVVERIKTARGYGDLSENYEYHAAKEEQGLLEARIRDLRAMLSRAQVVEAKDGDDGVAGLGSIVTVYDEEFEEELVYTIVTVVDADPMEDKISDQSPIGGALMGKQAGDVVEFQAPAGTHQLKIVKVEQGGI